ncbi:hypothetical protein DFJ74DRAFT_201460 [Hyaloraphidium curvatum]|nr:hypothetical protein DFJ74DRAFT_201460 [Hyaloraphidium curvatum]
MQALVSSTASGGAARHSTGQESRRSFACLADGGGGVGALPLCAAAGVPALHALPRHVGGRARHRAVGRAPPRGRLLRAGRAALPAAAAAAHAGPDRGRVPRRAHRRAPAGRGVCAHPAARGRQRGAARGPEAAHPAAAVVPGSGREELFVGPGGMEVHPAQSSDDAAAGLCRHHARGGGRGADAAGSADGARARADGPGHRVVVLCRQADGAGQAAAAAGRLVQAVWAVAGGPTMASCRRRRSRRPHLFQGYKHWHYGYRRKNWHTGEIEPFALFNMTRSVEVEVKDSPLSQEEIFANATRFEIEHWTQGHRFPKWLAVGNTTQHPAVARRLTSGTSLHTFTAIRMWKSDYEGELELSGKVMRDGACGDGIVIRVLCGNETVYERDVPPDKEKVTITWDVHFTVAVGTEVEVQIDPKRDDTCDRTSVWATISSVDPDEIL